MAESCCPDPAHPTAVVVPAGWNRLFDYDRARVRFVAGCDVRRPAHWCIASKEKP